MAWSAASLLHRFEDVRVFSSRDLSSKELDELGEDDDDDEDEGSFELGQNAVPTTRSVHQLISVLLAGFLSIKNR